MSSTFDHLEYTIECELKVLTNNPQNANDEFQRCAGKRDLWMNYVLWAIKDPLRGIEPDSCTLLELVVSG
ncbi:MAG: hypothetical protein KAJ55_10535 [Anaerolineales bacterium]|nr:hypothetical protein [Anaerolineales bacterium]